MKQDNGIGSYLQKFRVIRPFGKARVVFSSTKLHLLSNSGCAFGFMSLSDGSQTENHKTLNYHKFKLTDIVIRH